MRRPLPLAALGLLIGMAGCSAQPPSPTAATEPPQEVPSATPDAAAGAAIEWHSVECGRLAPRHCDAVAGLVAGVIRPVDFVPGIRLVVDDPCPPTGTCDTDLSAIAVVLTPGWQGLDAMSGSAFAVGGFSVVERWQDRGLPRHIVDLVRQAPADPLALWRPDLMVATPSRVHPGEVFEVSYTPARERGLGYALERWAGDAWHFEYDIVIRPNGDPIWQEAGVPGGWEVDLVGFGGPGPDLLVVPPIARPGAYRVCTNLGADNICALVEVEDPDAPAAALVDLAQTCANEELGYAISYPAGWFVHPAGADGDVPACAFFGPEPFELVAGDSGQLLGGSITVRVAGGGCLGYDESPISHHLLTVDGALGYVDEFAPFFTAGGTWYVLDLVPGDDLCAGANQGGLPSTPARRATWPAATRKTCACWVPWSARSTSWPTETRSEVQSIQPGRAMATGPAASSLARRGFRPTRFPARAYRSPAES
jgi:hypothetical protein